MPYRTVANASGVTSHTLCPLLRLNATEVHADNQAIVLAQLDDIALLPTFADQTVEPSEAAVSN